MPRKSVIIKPVEPVKASVEPESKVMQEPIAGGEGNSEFPLPDSYQKCRWFLTWYNWNEEKWNILSQYISTNCKWGVFQEEIGNESQKSHLQGCFSLKKKQYKAQLNKIFDGIWLSPMKDDAAGADYCQKVETSTGRKFSFGINIPTNIIKIPDWIIKDLYPWQKSIYEQTKGEAHKRHINWIYDKEGEAGKTAFSKYMLAHERDRVVLATITNYKDISCLLAIKKYGNKYQKPVDIDNNLIFIFNLARDCEKVSYILLEAIKDGLLTSPKYETVTMDFKEPHVWVMANIEPDSTKLQSKNRLKIWSIKEKCLVPYTPTQPINIPKKDKPIIYQDFNDELADYDPFD